ncbi:hypothetical protein BGZ46_009822 [Entomortierella lignicola]|nr:hypothetical protein BGZ46_009822 [Entomortierella lignicola]
MKFTFLATLTAMVATASASFVSYSAPNFHGHKQTFKETPGCYQLNGKYNVSSFKGVNDALYSFFSEGGCTGSVLYSSTSAPQRNITPPINKPRSFKILNSAANVTHVTLTTFSRPDYHGSHQTLKATGCRGLNGSRVGSFKGYGGYRYKFYNDRGCLGIPVLQSKGGDKKNIHIKPSSVYIYKN